MHHESPNKEVYPTEILNPSIKLQLADYESQEENHEAIQRIGQTLDDLFDSETKEQILRMIIYQTTGSQDTPPELSKLTEKGGCVAIVLCDYFVLARERNVLNFLTVRHSMVHLAFAASAKHSFDMEKSVDQFNKLMSTEKTDNGHFYGLEEFYRPSHGRGKSDMFGYFQFLVKIYIDVDVLEQIMTQSPNLLFVVIDLILGGMTTVTGPVQQGFPGFNDIALQFMQFLYMGAKRNTMLLQPAFGLLYVGVAMLKVIFDASKKAFKKELSDDEIKDLLYNTIYTNHSGQQIFSIASEFAGDESLWAITAHVHEQNGLNGTNVYALHSYIIEMFSYERLEALDDLFSNDGHSAIDLCRKARKHGFAIDPWVKKAYDNNLHALVEDVRQLFVSMAIAHGHATQDYEPLLDVMVAAMKTEEENYKKSKKTRNLYKSSVGTTSWKSVISEKVLKCKKAKGRYNKKVIENALKKAHADHTKAQSRVVDTIFIDESTRYEKIIEMLKMHQLVEDYTGSEMGYLNEQSQEDNLSLN
jgi:hypothetical protein